MMPLRLRRPSAVGRRSFWGGPSSSRMGSISAYSSSEISPIVSHGLVALRRFGFAILDPPGFMSQERRKLVRKNAKEQFSDSFLVLQPQLRG
jgi:hypothetical protein